ncbi:hypothetical protein SAY87_025465 [Trapa incisa]|uniref:GATA-type domain-containing protein n=1 Tax=Trapa incisa TaxID=236973 RepID=A0AAN7JG72_9MYRT|nr:hypothetical protein SAY87_025465 [Trapa incisa]
MDGDEAHVVGSGTRARVYWIATPLAKNLNSHCYRHKTRFPPILNLSLLSISSCSSILVFPDFDMVGSWLSDENLRGITDGFDDNVIKHDDFPLEDVDGDVLGDDWDAKFQQLELPSSDILAGLPSGFVRRLCDDESGPLSTPPKHSCFIFQYEEKPKLKDGSLGYGEATSDENILSGDIGDSSLLQTTSRSVSVLESGNSHSTDDSVNFGFKSFIPVKRARSKRLGPTSRNPWVTSIPFASYLEKRKGKKNISIHLDCISSNVSTFPSNMMRSCLHCGVTKTPQWREGPMGPKTLCNACGVRYRSGRLFPEYRPAASPTFVPSLHSNSHKKVIEMRMKANHEGPVVMTV